MDTLLGFGILILVIINFCIYHKFVTTIYFDFPSGCATELFWIAIATAFEIAIVKGIILKIFGAIGAVLGVVGKIILIVVIVAVVAFIVWKIVQIIQSKSAANQSGNQDGRSTVNFTQKAQDMFTRNTGNVKQNVCPRCGKPIQNGVNFCQYCGSRVENNR